MEVGVDCLWKQQSLASTTTVPLSSRGGYFCVCIGTIIADGPHLVLLARIFGLDFDRRLDFFSFFAKTCLFGF